MILLACIALALGVVATFAAVGYRNAAAVPVVRRLSVVSGDYPRSAEPTRIVLLSDLHVHGPDMPPERLGKIVDQINSLHPDIDVIAGDFVGNTWVGRRYPLKDAIAPLAGLNARYGTYAVLGNNDQWSGGAYIRQLLERADVHVLMNEAVQVGPIALAGINDRLHRSGELPQMRRNTYQALARTPGVKVLLAHRPDEFRAAPPWVRLVMAGHTHCGQIVLPVVGALVKASKYGSRYLCGVVREGSKVLVVTAGLGTSHLPIRIGAPPDIWLITLRGN